MSMNLRCRMQNQSGSMSFYLKVRVYSTTSTVIHLTPKLHHLIRIPAPIHQSQHLSSGSGLIDLPSLNVSSSHMTYCEPTQQRNNSHKQRRYYQLYPFLLLHSLRFLYPRPFMCTIGMFERGLGSDFIVRK